MGAVLAKESPGVRAGMAQAVCPQLWDRDLLSWGWGHPDFPQSLAARIPRAMGQAESLGPAVVGSLIPVKWE